MTLKKFILSIISAYALNSFPLFGQVYRSYNLEVGVEKYRSVLNDRFSNRYNNYPLGMHLIYWRDLGTSENLDLNKVIEDREYKTLCNKMYNYPLVGIYFQYLGNNHDDIGNAYTLGLTSDIGIWQKRSNYISFRPKIGASYFANHYDPITNPYNLAISSPLNLNLSAGFFYTIQEPIHTLRLGLEWNHYSNGATKQPNYGLNLVSLGLSYQFGTILYPWAKSERLALQDAYLLNPTKNYLALQLSGFSKQFEYGSKHYTGFNTTLMYAQPMNLWIDVNAKLHLSQDPSRKVEALQASESIPNNMRAAISLGMITHFHRLNLHTNAGIYIYKPDKVLDQIWFQQYQLDFILSKKLYTFTSITSHLDQVDYLDFGFGVKL